MILYLQLMLVLLLSACLSLDCGNSTNCLVCKAFNGTLGCQSCATGYNLFYNNFGVYNCICEIGKFSESANLNSGLGVLNSFSCGNCHVSCQNCVGPAAHQCTTCLATRHFWQKNSITRLSNNIKVTYGYCFCTQSTYSNGAACSNCASSTNCKYCQSSSDCIVCKNTYFVSGTGCALCSTAITSCSQCSSNRFCTLCNTNFYLYNNQCRCKSGYFSSSANACTQCNTNCLSCSGASTVCLSCNSASGLIITKSNKCDCDLGYFLSGVSCIQCSIYCSSCTNINSCLSCNSGFALVLNVCTKCHYSCATCFSGITLNDCASCSSGLNRVFNAPKCLCVPSFYDAGVALCDTCSANCVSCSFKTLCLSCVTSKYLTQGGYCADCGPNCVTCNSYDKCVSCALGMILSNQVCICPVGTYQSGSAACSSCQASCQSCEGPRSTDCLSCLSTRNQTLVNKRCVCQAGTIFNSGTNLCNLCTAPCVTCSLTITTCLSCASNKFLSSNTCTDCDANCLSCLTSSTFCVSCAYGNNRSLSASNVCTCADGYYDDPPNLPCLPCALVLGNCLLCSSSTVCTSCKIGFYIHTDFTCKACAVQCEVCASVSTLCIFCSLTLNRAVPPVCDCAPGYSLISLTSPVCQPCNITIPGCQLCRFFQAAVTGVASTDVVQCQICLNSYCSNCNYKCLSCLLNQINYCLSCDTQSFRQLVGSDCVCGVGYFDPLVSQCIKCHYSCLTCTGSLKSTCLTCQSNANFNRRVLPSNGECDCNKGFYDPGSLNCEICSSSCNQCVGNPFYCTKCLSPLYLINGACVASCPPGYATDPKLNYCSVCLVGCSLCTVDYFCLKCLAPNILFNEACTSSCPVNMILQLDHCMSCHPDELIYANDCVNICPFQTAVKDSSLRCFPQNGEIFLLNFTGYRQTAKSTEIYFYSTTDVTSSTLNLGNIETDMIQKRFLQQLTSFSLLKLNLISTRTYRLTLPLYKRQFNNTPVIIFFKDIINIVDSNNKVLSNRQIQFIIQRSINSQVIPTMRWLSSLGAFLSTVLTLISVISIVLVEPQFIVENMRIHQTLFFLVFFSNIKYRLMGLLTGLQVGNFFWFSNPFLALLPENYFQNSGFQFFFVTTDMNFLRNAGSQLFLLLISAALLSIPLLAIFKYFSYRVRFLQFSLKVINLITYPILFFGLAQFKTILINPTPVFKSVFTASAVLGVFLSMFLVLLYGIQFIYNLYNDCLKDEQRRVVFKSKEINPFAMACLLFFKKFYRVLVSLTVIFYSSRNGWLIILALELLYVSGYFMQVKSYQLLGSSLQRANQLLSSLFLIIFCLLGYFESSEVVSVILVVIFLMVKSLQGGFQIIGSVLFSSSSVVQQKKIDFQHIRKYFFQQQEIIKNEELKQESVHQQLPQALQEQVSPPSKQPEPVVVHVQEEVEEMDNYIGGMEEIGRNKDRRKRVKKLRQLY